MKFKIHFLLVFTTFLISAPGKTQDAEVFNKIYIQAYLEIAPKDVKRAFDIADSLYKTSTLPLFQAKSLMLSATLYQQKQELTKSIAFAEKADSIISKTNDYNWKVRICGFLATQYRLMLLYNKSRSYSQKALGMISQIENPETANSAAGLMKQELAYYDQALKNYRSSIQHIQESQKHFSQITQNRDFLMAGNEQLLGLNYYYLKDYENALKHYHKGMALLSNLPPNITTGLIYNGMAGVFIETNELVKAKRYLDSAIKVANESPDLQLKNVIYKTSQDYYTKTNDLAKLQDTRQKQDTVTEQIFANATSAIDSLVLKLEKQQQATEADSNKKDIYIIVGITLLLGGIFFFFLYRKKQKKIMLEKFKAALQQAEQKEHQHIRSFTATETTDTEPAIARSIKENEVSDSKNAPENVKAPTPYPNHEENSLIPEETKLRLLTSLREFEYSNLFTSGNISLSYLSAHLNTNSKYLSYVIKKYKQKDFNSYINELRINYIMENLKNNPEWRQYKISVLAEKGGFSSHSKFATIFKANTGLSPSIFIQYLSQDKGDQY
ncbi:MAG TPA: helix-turn-helix domain-containing protein [Niabella sp.]|nr:helix-turn-helix domain-containing protein [Niabella sp.]